MTRRVILRTIHRTVGIVLAVARRLDDIAVHVAHDLPTCDDCPIGGRDGSGSVCPRAALCDREAAQMGG